MVTEPVDLSQSHTSTLPLSYLKPWSSAPTLSQTMEPNFLRPPPAPNLQMSPNSSKRFYGRPCMHRVSKNILRQGVEPCSIANTRASGSLLRGDYTNRYTSEDTVSRTEAQRL